MPSGPPVRVSVPPIQTGPAEAVATGKGCTTTSVFTDAEHPKPFVAVNEYVPAAAAVTVLIDGL